MIYADVIRQNLSFHSQNEGTRREKNPDTICCDHCKGSDIRKDVLTAPFSLCWIQCIEFENNKKKKKSEPNKSQETWGKLKRLSDITEKEASNCGENCRKRVIYRSEKERWLAVQHCYLSDWSLEAFVVFTQKPLGACFFRRKNLCGLEV